MFAKIAVPVALIFTSEVLVIAQASPISDLEWMIKLITQAPVLGVLVWFMLRLERIIKDNTTSNQLLVRGQMVLVMTFKDATEGEKEQAMKILKELDEMEKKS